jgi:hypothetical protein
VKYFALCRLAPTYFPEVDPDSLQTISDTFFRGTLEYLLSHKAWELHQAHVLRVDYAKLTSGLEGFSTVLSEVLSYLKAERMSDHQVSQIFEETIRTPRNRVDAEWVRS